MKRSPGGHHHSPPAPPRNPEAEMGFCSITLTALHPTPGCNRCAAEFRKF